MALEWFKARRYRHFDLPVSESFANKITDPARVVAHNFVPLIHYMKREKRYKKCAVTKKRKIEIKERPIKYASHRDSCILAYYAHQLSLSLESFYIANGLSRNVIAYRSLGRSNYHFAAEALAFAHENAPAMILAFDVTSFFDTLDHDLLKTRISELLKTTRLTSDWYRIFRTITNYYYVDIEDLRANSKFSSRLRGGGFDRIASVEELKAAGIVFHPNPEVKSKRRRGIPQGTPISAAASNAYMTQFDIAANAASSRFGALYRRYSDDILIICRIQDANDIEKEITDLIDKEKLSISSHKTERTEFAPGAALPRTTKAAQYLGFTLDEHGAAIRESSLARQWRKMRRAIRKAHNSAKWRLAAGNFGKAHTKKLYRRFSYIAINNNGIFRALRNFSSYGRRSAEVFGRDERISKQVRRFERAALLELSSLKRETSPQFTMPTAAASDDLTGGEKKT